MTHILYEDCSMCMISVIEFYFWAPSQNCEKRILASTCLLSVCLSLRPFVRTEQLGSHWTDFHKIWYMSIFRKSVEKKIQV
jgi:hypothetical protein